MKAQRQLKERLHGNMTWRSSKDLSCLEAICRCVRVSVAVLPETFASETFSLTLQQHACDEWLSSRIDNPALLSWVLAMP